MKNLWMFDFVDLWSGSLQEWEHVRFIAIINAQRRLQRVPIHVCHKSPEYGLVA